MPPFGYPLTCPYHHEVEISGLKSKLRLLGEKCKEKDELLKEMAEALQGMADIYYGRDNQPIAGTYARKMDEVLQKYYEQEGE